MIKKKKFRAIELNRLDNDTIMNIRTWRNQDFVRKQMFTQNIIEEDEHLRWINSIRKDDNRHLFVFYLDNEPFAVVQSRYYPEHDYVETGDYLISEEYQAMGYGTFVKFYCSEIMYSFLGYKKIHGEILDINKKNLRTAQRIYQNIRKSEEKREVDGSFHDVYIVDSEYNSWGDGQRDKLGALVFKFIEKNYEVLM